MINKNSILFTFSCIVLMMFVSAGIVRAQDDKLPVLEAPDLKVSVPGLSKLEDISCKEGTCKIPWLAQYVAGLQRYGIAVIGILAVIGLMIGGIVWLTAGGNQEQIGSAKKIMGSSVLGLILMFASYVILYTINPNLTLLKSLNVTTIERVNLEELLIEINATDSLTESQANVLNSLDKQGVIKHIANISKKAYMEMSCNKSNFAGGKAVDFATTGYWKPGPWANTTSFFCQVGLNCSCPEGKKSFFDASCNNGNNRKCPYFGPNVKYCNQNAAGVEPQIGTIAADLSCFNKGDKVCLGGKMTLTVMDTGSKIQGRRFDIWNANDYKGALASTGLASVTLGACK